MNLRQSYYGEKNYGTLENELLNTGIYNIGQLAEPKCFKNLFGRDKRISITLYDQILSHSKADYLAERILLLFTDERGAYKRTYANRFAEFDQIIKNILIANFNTYDFLKIHDVAVSDGRTAVDFFNDISSAFDDLRFIASDYNPKVKIIERGNIKLTLGLDDKLIEIVWPPFVFNAVLPDRYWYEPFNRILQFFVEKIIVPPIMHAYKSGEIKPRDIYLYAPETLKLAKANKQFILSEHNILSPFTEEINVIRAMNVLNPGYFTKHEFASIVNNVYSGLVTNGLFIVGSNQDSGTIVNGGVYKKIEHGFEKLWQSGTMPHIEKYMTIC